MQIRMLGIHDVLKKLGKSRSSLYAMLDCRSRYFDAEMPRPIRIGTRSVRWFEDELETYLASRPRVGRQPILRGDGK